jgi:3-phosphoshikimate 1-carboxyvinyltransferase
MSQIRLTSAATVSIEESSQFASALLLCAKHGGWKVEVTGENAEESPYVAMTSKMMEVFPHRGGKFQIEPDASSGSYFWAADWLQWTVYYGSEINQIIVKHWPTSDWQIDTKYFDRRFIPKLLSRKKDLGDSIMTAIAVKPFDSKPNFHFTPNANLNSLSDYPTQFTDLGRLRLQETERVVALRTELTKCGAKVVEGGDTLTVYPSKLHGAEIETYNDHRMAMCFAILGLKVPGIKIKNPACVKKTFPNFFQKLTAPPPKGLGAAILDAKTGRKLKEEELFAD